MKITEQNASVTLKIRSGLISTHIPQYNADVVALMNRKNYYEELVLDLSETDTIDSFGVSFIIGLYKSCLNDGKQFRIANSSDDIVQLFRLMKLEEFFDLD